MLTGLTLRTDRSEYSRHETSRSTVKVRILPVPATALAETVLLNLRRKGGPVLSSQEVALTGDLPKGIVTTFDLTAIKDADNIPLCVQGEYQIDAYSPPAGYLDPETPNLVTASTAFRVSLITVEEMRNGYCFGVPLYASDMPMAKKQPVLVTGVRLVRLSEDTPKGVHAISYTAATNSLSWAGGPQVTIDSSKELLPDQYGGYAEVEIDEFELPGIDASEGIVVDKKDIDDEFIREQIAMAIAEVESVILKVFVEPYRMATEPYFSAPAEGEFFDRLAQPIMYTKRDFNSNGLAWRLDLPYHQVQKVDRIEGFMGNTKALVIGNGALAVQRKTGEVNVLPFDSSYAFLYTFHVQMRFWGFREYIADFWHYTAVVGLPEAPPEILKLVGYVAAVTLLTIGGQGYRGGYSSESNSKDGVSRSVSYTASASYGIYSATIVELKEWIKVNGPKIRAQHRGIPTVVL